MALFEAERHEALAGGDWNADRAAAAVDSIISRTTATYASRGDWPSDPNDLGPLAPAPNQSLYFGAAGIVWALAQFGVRVPNDGELLQRAADYMTANPLSPDPNYHRGLLLGPTGAHLVSALLTADPTSVESLYRLVRANVANEVCDFMWGSAGTMLAARTMFDATRDVRWKDAFVDSARALEGQISVTKSGARAWTQHLYGHRGVHIGLGHGFAGNVAPILSGRDLLPPDDFNRWRALAVATTRATALSENGFANWPQSIDGGRPGRASLLVQTCHGAPGMIEALGELCDGSEPEFDALMRAGGELTWSAGPLLKGAGLCHGTAGNGYAFLRLFHQTRDDKWLRRARAFAMHALRQSEAAARAQGELRHSLWTGDVGVALFVRACESLDPRFPTLGYF